MESKNSVYVNKLTLRGDALRRKDGQGVANTKYTPDGKAFSTFRICVPEEYTKKDGQLVSKKMYYMVTAWGALAEDLGNLKDNDLVEVFGRLRNYGFPDKNDPKKMIYKWEIVATSVKKVERTAVA